MANSTASSFTALQASMVDLKTGKPSHTWQKQLQVWQTQLSKGFDAGGNLISGIEPSAEIVGRSAGIGPILQNLDDGGVVTAAGIDFTRSYANKNTDNIADGAGQPLAGGKAAYQAFLQTMPVAGQALVYSGTAWVPGARAQTTPVTPSEWLQSYNDSDGSFTKSQPTFTDIAGNIASSQLPAAGQSVSVTLAKLTSGGADGSLTFTNGILTASTPPS